MKKPMIIMLSVVGTIFFLIFAYKTFWNYMLHRLLSNYKPSYTVSAMTADYSAWQPKHEFFGSMRAVKGVNVTTELAGLVVKIYFKDGAYVKKGDLLVQLNPDAELGTLHSLQANTALALITLRRDTAQYAIQAISKQTLDNDIGNYKNLLGQTAQEQATVDKKAIRAPFSGRMGISVINPGQYVNNGETIAPLQELDPIYMDFYVPQQQLFEIKAGQPVVLKIDALPNQTFKGKVSAINPVIDASTRNVQVEAIFSNPKIKLTPGMFGSAVVDTGSPKRYITVPQSSISYNPYGNLIYTLKKVPGKMISGNQTYIATQQFVITGDTRGDQIAVLKGISKGDMIVTSGQVKIKNGSTVTINNSVIPKNDVEPNVKEE